MASYWSKYIEVIVAKANKTLGLIKRLLKDTSDLKVRKILFCSLVRPMLEYTCNLWSPYTAKPRKLIENVQRRFFRNSIFIRSVELWNSLPSNVKSSSTFSSLTGHLHKLYLAKLIDALRSSRLSFKYYRIYIHCDLPILL